MMEIVYDGSLDSTAFKDAFGKLIARLCDENPDVIYLDADLMNCVATAKWSEEHPERGINCGIAEANMMGIASGLAASGFRPIVHTFGPFASRRSFDQVFLSAGYSGNPITIVGSDPGVTAAFNGGTHMPFEDTALYRTIPNATVIEATDTAVLASVLEQSVKMPGVKYIRMPRKPNARVYADGTQMPIGKAVTLRDGKDAVIFASGIMVHEAMQAAATLDSMGIDAAVVDVFTIKPLDRETIISYAKKCGAVVIAENHNKIGGLYSAVCETLIQEYPVRCACVAVEDEFGEVGPQDYLQSRYGLTAQNIVEKVKALADTTLG